MKKYIFSLIVVLSLALAPSVTLAKGGGGGGHSSSHSSSRSSSSVSRSSSRSTPSRSVSRAPAKPAAPKVSSRPTRSTPKVTSTTTKTVSGKKFGKTGSVVGEDYHPSFRGGYAAPAGSVVYYRQSSMLDWLPFYMIMSSQNAHRDAVVVEPSKDGQPAKETIVKEEGVDGMYVFNWIFSILLVVGLIAFIVYKVNKRK